jgi:hypothetical protein
VQPERFWRPGIYRNPEPHFAALCEITKMSAGSLDIFRSFFKTEVTSTFIWSLVYSVVRPVCA